MPTFRALLPRLAAHLPSSVADEAIEVHSLDFVYAVASAVEVAQRGALEIGLAELLAVSDELDREVQTLEPLTRPDVLCLLRLVVTTRPLTATARRREFGTAWEWAVKPCVTSRRGLPEGAVEVDVDLGPVLSVSGLSPFGPVVFLQWAGQICYLGWTAGYLTEVATIVAPIAASIALAIGHGLVEAEDLIEATCHVASFLHREAEVLVMEIIALLDSIVSDREGATDIRLAVARFLTTAPGSLSAVPRPERAEQLLLNHGSAFEPAEKIQLFASAYSDDLDRLKTHLPRLVQYIDQHNSFLNEEEPDPLNQQVIRGRMFDVLVPILLAFLRVGDTRHASFVLGRWLAIARPRCEGVLFCASLENRTLWAFEGDVVHGSPHDTDVTGLINSSLGLALADRDNPRELHVAPTNPGVPVGTLAGAFQKGLNQVLQPQLASELMQRSRHRATALVNLAQPAAPVASLVARSGGPELPLGVSLTVPAADRKLRRAEIWFGDVTLAEHEARAVAAILRRASIRVDTVDGVAAGSSRFLSAYSDPDLDLLWLSSHAEFGHWLPRNTRLVFDHRGEIFLTIGDLLGSRQPTGPRRLLVLDSCASGTLSALGGPSTLGLAGATAGPSQAVVSHLWPVGFLAAAVSGVLLASGLGKGLGFYAAFLYSSALMKAGPQGITMALRAIEDANFIADRFENRAQGFTFFESDSSVFVE